MRNLFLSLLTVLMMSIAQSGSVYAKSPHPELNLSSSGLALRGYDPVGYFTAKKPVKGMKDITVKNGGATYRFASEENKKLFQENPTKYLPAYGGYCAYGTAVGAKVDGDPKLWSVVKGKLYLNINYTVDQKWKKDKSSYISTADKKWPDLKNK